MKPSHDDWKECLLGEAVTLKRGYDLTMADRQDGPYPVITSSGFAGFHSEAKVKGPGVVTGRYGTLGEVHYVETDFWPHNTALYVRDFKGNHPKFISYFLGGLHFNTQNAAAAVPGVNRNFLHMIPVRVPSLKVQRQIAGILSAYDELIENSLRRIRLLEEMARALYREWFVHFRFPGHEKYPRVTSPLGDIPKGWEVMPVESFCPLVSRGVTPKYEAGSGRFIINQKVNRGSELALDDLKELEPLLEVPADKFARFGDVLVNCLGEGTIGRVHFYAEPHQEWAVDQHMSICRATSPTVSLYVYCALESPEGQGRITSLKTGGTNMTMFNISALRTFTVVAPPAKLMARFAELTLPMLRQKQALTELNRNLRRTRDLLLPRLLSGQVALEA